VGGGEEHPADVGVTVAASLLVDAVLGARQPAGLVVSLPEGGAARFRVDASRSHLDSMLVHLATARLHEGTSLEVLLATHVRAHQPGTTVAIVTGTLHDGVADAVRRLRVAGQAPWSCRSEPAGAGRRHAADGWRPTVHGRDRPAARTARAVTAGRDAPPPAGTRHGAVLTLCVVVPVATAAGHGRHGCASRGSRPGGTSPSSRRSASPTGCSPSSARAPAIARRPPGWRRAAGIGGIAARLLAAALVAIGVRLTVPTPSRALAEVRDGDAFLVRARRCWSSPGSWSARWSARSC
jgi:hypothetical protein